ncbi:putative FAS-associated factor 2 [Paratrimastix pyriformis]|uniref:FAS-associated factor 2 n=1 Tax=Paratrimastix pyriformis TaxID=342808 RepID=A0ABQ8UQT1_9EUKA|nr:putative FAS-associated factor 2 [Paratrimastix pyriformis]
MLKALKRLFAPPGAGQTFTEFYRHSFGERHPRFLGGTHLDALQQARDQSRFLAIFLLSPSHASTEQFCKETLASDSVISFFDERLLLWGCSIHQKEGYLLSQELRAAGFPFLALVEPGQPHPTVIDTISGFLRPQELITRISNSIAVRQAALAAVNTERDERDEARQLRQDQDREYQAALAEDQARLESQEAARRQAEEERERKEMQDAIEQSANEAVEMRRQRLIRDLPPEPPESDSVRIRIRLPAGELLERRFAPDHLLQHVVDFLESKEYPPASFSLSTPFPRRSFSEADYPQTLRSLGFYPQAPVLIVAPRSDVGPSAPAPPSSTSS